MQFLAAIWKLISYMSADQSVVVCILNLKLSENFQHKISIFTMKLWRDLLEQQNCLLIRFWTQISGIYWTPGCVVRFGNPNIDFGTSSRRCSRSLLGGQLATKLVVTISAVIFSFNFSPFSPLRPFLKEGVLRLKTYSAKVDWYSNNLELDPLPDPVGHFVNTWQSSLD